MRSRWAAVASIATSSGLVGMAATCCCAGSGLPAGGSSKAADGAPSSNARRLADRGEQMRCPRIVENTLHLVLTSVQQQVLHDADAAPASCNAARWHALGMPNRFNCSEPRKPRQEHLSGIIPPYVHQLGEAGVVFERGSNPLEPVVDQDQATAEDQGTAVENACRIHNNCAAIGLCFQLHHPTKLHLVRPSIRCDEPEP